MRINLTRAVGYAAVLSAALPAMASAQVGISTYGQDPVPDSQFYDGPISLGYGIDKVPSSSMSDHISDRLYGMDEIPRTRFYTREHDASPVLVNPTQQGLTGDVEGGEAAGAPDASTRNRGGR